MEEFVSQEPLRRPRPPRAYITYDVEVTEPEPAVELRELPFVIGVLAELGAKPEVPLKKRSFTAVDRENFEEVRAAFVPDAESSSAEAAWQGLRYLVSNVDPSANVKVRVLDVSKQELLEDFRAAGALERSAVFAKVCAEVSGTRLADPFGVLIGDYEFGHEAEGIELLGSLSELAAAALAPFIAAASPQMFGVRAFTELPAASTLARRFDDDAGPRWRAFRDSDGAAYVGLVLPRVALPGPAGLGWGNAAYALGVRLAEAFWQHGWCAAIQGIEGGGLVTGLPAGPDGGPTEVPIPEDLEQVLGRLGFISLCQWKRTDRAAFFSVPSCQRPRIYDHPAASAAAALAVRLPYVFAVSRFAQYLKVMMRDRIGSVMSREECEQSLNAWISNYVVSDDEAPEMVQAMYPLREARIDVVEVPEKPGALQAVAFLRPHFQLQDPGLCLRVVVDLPPSSA